MRSFDCWRLAQHPCRFSSGLRVGLQLRPAVQRSTVLKASSPLGRLPAAARSSCAGGATSYLASLVRVSYLVRVLRQVRFSPRSVFRSTRSRALRMPRAFASPPDDLVPPPPCSFAARTSTHFCPLFLHRVYAHEAPAFCKPLFCSRARVRFVKSPRGRFAVDSNR